MKKLSILLCLSAVAMLTACGGDSSSSATSGAEATSSVAESENSAASEASSQEGEAYSGETASSDAATSTEAEASSEEAATGWSKKILDEIAEYCGEGFEVPYLSGKVTEAYYDEDYYCYSIVVENTDLDGYADLVEEAGYAVAYDENYEAYSGVMILDNYDNVELSFYLLSSGEEIEIDVYYTEAYQAWPSEEIDYVAEQWEVTATPIEFAANAYLTGADSNLSYYYIKAYEDDPEASAEALIKAYTDSADWTVNTMGEGEESYYLFASTNGDSWVTLEVGEDTVTVVWQVAQGLLAWPSDQIASFLADAGLENPTDIPVFEADVYSMQVSDPYFVISVDYEEAQTNDPAAAYAKALTDAGWTVTTEEDELGVI
ncbi:MAG: hypothetical protein K6F32_04115, partial [Bacilli bacterium]|nr:hypothetical protein [Bacilli bacterium]